MCALLVFPGTFVSIEPLDPLGTMAKKMDLSLSQTINLLSELGVRSPIGHDDYLESYAAARSLVADAED